MAGLENKATKRIKESEVAGKGVTPTRSQNAPYARKPEAYEPLEPSIAPSIRAVPSCPSPDQSARLPRKSINQRAEAIPMMNADKSCIFQIGNQSVSVRVAALAGETVAVAASASPERASASVPGLRR